MADARGGFSVLFYRIDRQRYTAEDLPEFPGLALSVHTLAKGAEGGALLGTIAGMFTALRNVKRSTGPASSASRARKPRNQIVKMLAEPLQRYLPRYALFGVLGFTALSVGLLGYKLWSMDCDGLVDRVYRLQHNASQNKVDKWCAIGAGLGVGLGARLGSPAGYAAVGTALGLLVYILDYSTHSLSRKPP
jgi:hypothetical protein